MELVHRQGHHYALVSAVVEQDSWSCPVHLATSRRPVSSAPSQKHMLLQVSEQQSAVEAEVRAHSLVQHRNVLQLVCSEIRENRDGSSTAFLLFPYYRVSMGGRGQGCMGECSPPPSVWDSAGPDEALPEEQPAAARGESAAADAVSVPGTARHAHSQPPASGTQRREGTSTCK